MIPLCKFSKFLFHLLRLEMSNFFRKKFIRSFFMGPPKKSPAPEIKFFFLFFTAQSTLLKLQFIPTIIIYYVFFLK